MIVKGQRVFFKAEWAEPGDAARVYVAADDAYLDAEGRGKVLVTALDTGLAFPPVNLVMTEWLEA